MGAIFADSIFQYVFVNEKFCILIFFYVCTEGSNYQYSSIGSDDGLVPIRWQAIIWTNADPVHWSIYAALGGDELIK